VDGNAKSRATRQLTQKKAQKRKISYLCWLYEELYTYEYNDQDEVCPCYVSMMCACVCVCVCALLIFAGFRFCSFCVCMCQFVDEVCCKEDVMSSRAV
jgi:hypothetical protein